MPCTNEKCLKCSSTSASTCDQCYGLHRDASNECKCYDGYYDVFVAGDNSTYDCRVCPTEGCKNCSASSPSECSECFGNNRHSGTCQCADGWMSMFVIDQTETYNCVQCDNLKCDNCTHAKSTCNRCFGTDESQRTTVNSCECPENGYYDAFVGGNPSTYDCVKCENQKCKRCNSTSASTCDVCYGAYRNASNECKCLPGYGDRFVSGQESTYDCVRCSDPACQTCDGPTGECTACFGPNRELSNHCNCSAGYRNYFR